MASEHTTKSNGTTVGLKDFFSLWMKSHETLADERFKNINDRFASEDKARSMAFEMMNVRLAAMNEFRDALRDQAGGFFTKAEHEAYMNSTEVELRALQDFKLSLETKASQGSVNIALVTSSLGILLSVISLVKEFLK